MHILGLLLGLLGGVGVWYWRARSAGQVVGEVADAAGHVRGAISRRRFRNKAEGSTLSGIEDPKLAAAVLFVSLVEAGRQVAREDEDQIAAWLRDVAEEPKPTEAVTFARWASREVVDVNEVIRRLTPLFRERLDRHEREDLIAAATTLVSRTGAPEPGQADALRRLRLALLPDGAR